MRRGRSRSKALATPPGGPGETPSQAESTSSEWEQQERTDVLRELAWRGGPRGPGSGGKGRSRREREQRSNWAVPAGHERKVAAKIRASLAKKRRREQKGPRSAPLQGGKSRAAGGGGGGGRSSSSKDEEEPSSSPPAPLINVPC